jgi:hypothetical protein
MDNSSEVYTSDAGGMVVTWEKPTNEELGTESSLHFIFNSLVDDEPLPTRLFSGPSQFPPEMFFGYGLLAFGSIPSKSLDRSIAICDAYFNSMASTLEAEYRGIKRAEQFVTV